MMEELIQFLKDYNRWRRGDETIAQPDPKEIGENLDKVIKILEKYGRLIFIDND